MVLQPVRGGGAGTDTGFPTPNGGVLSGTPMSTHYGMPGTAVARSSDNSA